MRIVVIESLVLIRELIERMCVIELGCVIVGQAGDGCEAIRVIESAKPDLVVLSILIPEIEGAEVVNRVHKSFPRIRFLALSHFCDDCTLSHVGRANFHGYVDLNFSGLEILKNAIRVISAGGRYFSDRFTEAKILRRKDPNSYDKILSERECAVLSLIGLSHSDDEIAVKLRICRDTAKTHRKRILHKLGFHSTPKLIAYALQVGLTRSGPSSRSPFVTITKAQSRTTNAV